MPHLCGGAYGRLPGGEIEALDPAGYGPITISGTLSIVGVPGAAINAPSGGAGITINAHASDAVHLQGLLIDGSGVGTTGIQFNSGGSLVVEDCVIRNLTNDGINIFNSADTVQVLISNTLVADNGSYGIFVFPTGSGSVTAKFDHVEASNNYYDNIALEADATSGTVTGTAFDTIAVGSPGPGEPAGAGFVAWGPASLNLYHSLSNYNYIGIVAYYGGTVRLYNSMVDENEWGWITYSGGGVLSYVNNSINGNRLFQDNPPTLGVK